MYQNNKGNTVIIVSVVVGVLVLSIGGYFGYTWYQNKLKKEKIDRLEKVSKAVDDVLEKYSNAGKSTGGNPTQQDFINYKKSVSNFKDSVKDLEKIKITDEDIKKDIKSCIEDGNGIAKTVDVIISIAEKKMAGRQITSTEISEVEAAVRNAEEYNDLKSCKDAKEKIEDTISELEK